MPILRMLFVGLGGGALLWQAALNVQLALHFHRERDWVNFSRRTVAVIAEALLGIGGVVAAILIALTLIKSAHAGAPP